MLGLRARDPEVRMKSLYHESLGKTLFTRLLIDEYGHTERLEETEIDFIFLP